MLVLNFRGPKRVRMDKDRPMPEIIHPNDAIVHKKIKGWGVDADLEVRPSKPVNRPQTDTGAHWDKPSPQPKTVEILKSI